MSLRISILLNLLFTSLLGFSQSTSITNPNDNNFLTTFSAPRIIDTLIESKSLRKASSIIISNPHIECVSPFTDTISLNKYHYNPWDTSINRLVDQRADGLQIFVDTTQFVTLTEDKIYDRNKQGQTNIYYKGFPCFIFNETKSIKWLYTQDSKVIVIQEAQDSNYNWRPIQIWNWSWCGNSYYRIPLRPNHFAFFKIPLFEGKYLARIRLKLYSADAIYYSNEFHGWINYKQFDLPKDLMGKKGKPGFNLSFLTSE